MNFELIENLIDLHLNSQLNLYMSKKEEYNNFDAYFGDLIRWLLEFYYKY